MGDIITNQKEVQEHYIGYSIVRPLSERCIGRTVIDPRKLKHLVGKVYSLSTKFKVHINGIQFSVNGFPYISQSTDVTVCAHSALWMVCRYLSQKFTIYPEIYPFDIIKLTDSSNGRTFPYRGMTYTDYSKILSNIGSFPVILRLKNSSSDKAIEPDRFEELYTYVESGFPVLASLPNHAVVIVGHTIDYEKRVSPVFGANYISSSQYLDSFVIVDDNDFPYKELKREKKIAAKDTSNQHRNIISNITNAVCPLPEKVFLPASKAIGWFKDFINRNRTMDYISKFGKGKMIVRIYLANSTTYKRRKLESDADTGKLNKISYHVTQMFLPHFIWVCELSSKEQYKNGLCGTEIVLDSTSSIKDNPLIYARFGNILYFSGIYNEIESDNTEHKQFTSNLGKII